MTFAAPLWLVGLLPWAAVVVFLFTGRRAGTQVPFLNLWRGPDAAPLRARASIVLPPISIVCILLSLLLAVLGAARPAWVSGLKKDSPGPTAATTRPSNVSIVNASAARLPRPQVMVRIRNDSEFTQSPLKTDQAVRDVQLPPRGEERNYFVDLDHLDPATSIDLNVVDDVDWDNHVSVVQKKAWPTLEAHGALPAEVERMIETYRKVRPASPAAEHVIVMTSIPANARPAVIVAPGSGLVVAGEPKLASHPINASVDWPTLTRQELRVAPPPGDGWQTIASVNDRPIVAVRESPARQVWFGMTSDTSARTADFVVLWTNMFDWVGQGDETFEMVRPPPPTTARPTETAALPIDLSPAFLIGAIGLIFVATAIWGTCKNCASG